MTSDCLPHQVPLNFEPAAAAYVVGESIVAPQAPFAEHPQTLRLVQKFGLASNFRTRRGATQPDLAQAGPTATVAGGLRMPRHVTRHATKTGRRCSRMFEEEHEMQHGVVRGRSVAVSRARCDRAQRRSSCTAI